MYHMLVCMPPWLGMGINFSDSVGAPEDEQLVRASERPPCELDCELDRGREGAED